MRIKIRKDQNLKNNIKQKCVVNVFFDILSCVQTANVVVDRVLNSTLYSNSNDRLPLVHNYSTITHTKYYNVTLAIASQYYLPIVSSLSPISEHSVHLPWTVDVPSVRCDMCLTLVA